MAPVNPVSRNAVKSHMMASFQTVARLCGELLEVTDARWSARLLDLHRHLVGEIRWLQDVGPRFNEREDDPRKPFVVRYARSVGAALGGLDTAVKTKPLDPKAFETLGLELLALMSLEPQARSL